MRATLLLRNLARNAAQNGTATARAAAPALQCWRRLATSPLATDAVNLDLSQAKALTCHNMMCEHVGEPCGCRIAAFLEQPRFRSGRSRPRAGLRVPDAARTLPRSGGSTFRATAARGASTTSRRWKQDADVTETALERCRHVACFAAPARRRRRAFVAPAGWTAAEGALERCVAARRRRRALGGAATCV